ncbi:hypothetical protein HMPREF1326_00589 [Akkermansia sp. KLE1605]|nr:hypothetical protein HMPREF1326_00589 [Akkermansia sp. KLE1605]
MGSCTASGGSVSLVMKHRRGKITYPILAFYCFVNGIKDNELFNLLSCFRTVFIRCR